MPVVRGRFVPEVQSTGRIKRFLDVLLWGTRWTQECLSDLDDIEFLRECIRSIRPGICGIRLFVPPEHADTIEALQNLDVRFVPIKASAASSETSKAIADQELANAVQTAFVCDADALVVNSPEWLPYTPDIDELGLLLTDTGFLKRYCETFVRGHDVPWALAVPIWGMAWNGFYHVSEQQTFGVGVDFVHAAQEKGLNAVARETGRSLVHNRLPNICFTRDRLLFCEMQKMAAKRAKWTRQEFAFEIGYYLNFYYPLIFGGFDHIALLVNQSLQLGLPDKNVGAIYKGFLDALKAKDAALHTLFTDGKQVEFMNRIGYLRHYASHRGALAPGKLVERPEKELTDDEVDAIMADTGRDKTLAFLPEGVIRESIRKSARANIRMAHYEKEGTVLDGVVPIEINGKAAFIHPLTDTTWNFKKFLLFMDKVLTELKARL